MTRKRRNVRPANKPEEELLNENKKKKKDEENISPTTSKIIESIVNDDRILEEIKQMDITSTNDGFMSKKNDVIFDDNQPKLVSRIGTITTALLPDTKLKRLEEYVEIYTETHQRGTLLVDNYYQPEFTTNLFDSELECLNFRSKIRMITFCEEIDETSNNLIINLYLLRQLIREEDFFLPLEDPYISILCLLIIGHHIRLFQYHYLDGNMMLEVKHLIKNKELKGEDDLWLERYNFIRNDFIIDKSKSNERRLRKLFGKFVSPNPFGDGRLNVTEEHLVYENFLKFIRFVVEDDKKSLFNHWESISDQRVRFRRKSNLLLLIGSEFIFNWLLVNESLKDLWKYLLQLLFTPFDLDEKSFNTKILGLEDLNSLNNIIIHLLFICSGKKSFTLFHDRYKTKGPETNIFTNVPSPNLNVISTKNLDRWIVEILLKCLLNFNRKDKRSSEQLFEKLLENSDFQKLFADSISEILFEIFNSKDRKFLSETTLKFYEKRYEICAQLISIAYRPLKSLRNTRTRSFLSFSIIRFLSHELEQEDFERRYKSGRTMLQLLSINDSVERKSISMITMKEKKKFDLLEECEFVEKMRKDLFKSEKTIQPKYFLPQWGIFLSLFSDSDDRIISKLINNSHRLLNFDNCYLDMMDNIYGMANNQFQSFSTGHMLVENRKIFIYDFRLHIYYRIGTLQNKSKFHSDLLHFYENIFNQSSLNESSSPMDYFLTCHQLLMFPTYFFTQLLLELSNEKLFGNVIQLLFNQFYQIIRIIFWEDVDDVLGKNQLKYLKILQKEIAERYLSFLPLNLFKFLSKSKEISIDFQSIFQLTKKRWNILELLFDRINHLNQLELDENELHLLFIKSDYQQYRPHNAIAHDVSKIPFFDDFLGNSQFDFSFSTQSESNDENNDGIYKISSIESIESRLITMDWNRFNNFDQNRFTILFNNYLTFREPLKLICRRFLFHLSIINDIERKEENIIFYKFNHLSYENDDDKNKSKSILSKWNDLYGKEWKTCENELYKLQKDYGKSIQSSFLSLLEVKDKLKLKKFLDDFHFLLDIHLRVGEKESSKQINRLINSYKNCFDKNKKKNEKCHLENFVKYICEKPLLISVDIDVMVENLLILEKKKYEESLINFLTKMMSYPHFFNKCAWENIMRIGENWIKSNHDISINNSTNESINNSTIRINRNKTSKFLFNDEKLSNFLLVSLKSLSNIFLKNFDIEKNLGELTSLIGDDIISNFCAMAIENLTGIPFLMESIERKINFDIKQLKKMRSDGNFLYFHSNSSFTDYSFDVWNSKQIKYLLKGLDTFLSNKQFIPLIIYVTDLILFRISRLVYISINQIVDDEIKLDYNLFIHDIIVLYYIIKRFPLIIFLYSKSELFEFVELEGEENENKKKLNDCFSSSYILQLIYFIFYNLFNENVEEKFPFIPSQIDSTSNHNNNLISFIYHVEKTNVEDDVGRNNVEKKYSIRQPKWKTNISYNFSISKKSNEHVSNFHQKFLIVRYSTKIISYLTCQFTELINRYDADDTTLLEDFECDIFSPIQYSDDDDYFYNLIATLNEMNKNISKIFQFSLINKFNFVYLMEEELMKERYIFELQHIQLTSCHHIEKQTTSRTTPNFLLTLINYLFIEDPSTEKYNEFTSIQEKKFNEIVKKFSKKNILNSHNCIYKELSILFIYFILFFETESKFIKIIKHCHSRFVHLNHQNRYDESKNVNIYNALPFMFWLLAIVFRHHLTSVNDLVIYSFLKKRYQRLLKILIDVTEDVVDLKILFEQLELCHPIYPNEIEGNNVEDIDMFTNVQRFDGMFEIMNVIVQKKKDEKKKNEQIIKQFHIDEIFFELDRESSNRSLYIPSKYQLFEDE